MVEAAVAEVKRTLTLCVADQFRAGAARSLFNLMLTTIALAGLFVATLLLGYFVGCRQTGRQWNRVFERYVCNSAVNHAALYLCALEALRLQQFPKAFRTLENGLDGEVITFGRRTAWMSLPPL